MPRDIPPSEKLLLCFKNISVFNCCGRRSLFRPSWLPKDAKVLLYPTRPKGALGYNPEVLVIAGGKQSTVVSSRDALTGEEISREELDFTLASALPLGEKDSKGRAMVMLVDRWGTRNAQCAGSRPESLALGGNHSERNVGDSGGYKMPPGMSQDIPRSLKVNTPFHANSPSGCSSGVTFSALTPP